MEPQENKDPDSKEPLVVRKAWEGLFPDGMAEQAKTAAVQAKIKNMRKLWYGIQADYAVDASEEPELRQLAGSFGRGRGYYRYRSSDYGCPGSFHYHVSVSFPEGSFNSAWDTGRFSCNCRDGLEHKLCIHEAAAIASLEAADPEAFYRKEGDWEYRKRMQGVRTKELCAELEAKRKQYGARRVPASTFFQDRKRKPGPVIYDMEHALSGWETDAYSMAIARDLLDQHRNWLQVRCREDVDRKGVHRLSAELSVRHPIYEYWAKEGRAALDSKTNELAIRSIDGYLGVGVPEDVLYDEVELGKASSDPFLNINSLVLLWGMWDFVDKTMDDVEDLTDENASRFFASLDKAAVPAASNEVPEVARKKSVALYPRLIMDDGEVKLSFRIARGGDRVMVVKSLQDLVGCYTDRTRLALSKTAGIDFATEDFQDDSAPAYAFIQRRIGEVHDANAKIEARNNYSVRTLKVTSSLDLKGALLDGFYDVWQGRHCSYEDKTNGIKDGEIPVGHRPLKIALTANRLADARGTFAGVVVDGIIPVLLKGSGKNRYVLDAAGLSRVTPEELDRIKPFAAVADGSGYFRFQVGVKHLQEFYYRVVPMFLDNPSVELTDHCAEEADSYLPPEPRFDFYLDCEGLDAPGVSDPEGEVGSYLLSHPKAVSGKEYLLTLKGRVEYEDKDKPGEPRIYVLGKSDGAEGYRDEAQERRVAKAVGRFLPVRFEGQGEYAALIDDDGLFDFLRQGLPYLEKFGTIHGTEAFRTHAVRPVPQLRFGVSVSSGIMDLSLTSQDLGPEELLAVLESYRLRKRFHKLSSGDYLDLTDGSQLAEAQFLLAGMDLKAQDVVGRRAQVPLYRALYLDKLLEEHADIASSRDRIYRALVRNFKTVDDSEIEPPKSLESVLRPYQLHGFKWMKTLEGAGFGGILADEMGLGKTLQMIAVLASDHLRKGKKPEPSLVVCPASLVYNWQEEFARFGKDLAVRPIAGNAAARKAALDRWEETDVFIISYDLLKRHIAQLAEKRYFYVVLDEAQYIKNAGAAVSKSVKALKASHRFALTGTPIENRLSELWSIFDFLMPGFLYDHKRFEAVFEGPITKDKDQEATQRLKKMTAPFMLRRRKEDVLKDLPAKMEEVRYVRISGEQQKLYDAQVLQVRDTILHGGSQDKLKVFAGLTRIRQICCDPSLLFEDYHGESAKREACLDLIRQAMDGGHRMLVFSQFTSMLALLEQDLRKEGIPYFLLTGSTPKEKRIQMVHAFNEGDTPVFLISLKAGGTGLNLTGADVVIHYDPWWNLAAQNQATDRTHRIGQTRQVTVYRLILKGTVEERILEMQEAKKDLADSVLSGDGAALSTLTREELLALVG